jgi:hypothetical protein
MYESDFAASFTKRTLEILKAYEGQRDATVLINCLLGLLVVPKEAMRERLPSVSFANLSEWGISSTSIRNPGQCDYGHAHQLDLRQLVRRLRNAVAHFRIEPEHTDGIVTAFSFKDGNGFHAVLTLQEIRDFVTKLCGHVGNSPSS